MSDSDSITQDAWYSLPGEEQDIVLSTRVRLSRNLADFAFPQYLKSEEAERVQTLVFDSFSHISNPDAFQSLRSSSLDSLGQRLLSERGMLPYGMYCLPWTGGVIRQDGKVSASVNYFDHLRLCSFSSGLNFEKPFTSAKAIDDELQNSLQFAASMEFGYLTSNLHDLGSGMKLTSVMHLPSITVARIADKVFKDLVSEGCSVGGFFAPFETGVPPGSIYIIENSFSYKGDEFEQIALFKDSINRVLECERGSTMNLTETRPTRIKDIVYRAVASVKYSRLISNREGIELVSKIKWGLNLGLLKGVEHHELSALLYRIQNAHLTYFVRNGKFNFEKDILSEELKIERIRALVLQEVLANLQIIV